MSRHAAKKDISAEQLIHQLKEKGISYSRCLKKRFDRGEAGSV